MREESHKSKKFLNCLTNSDLQKLEVLYKNSGELDNDRIPDVIEKLSSTISKLKDSLSKSSRTSRLWINYIIYINIVKTFIRAERTGNWDLHLTVVANMIDLFAATKLIHYCEKCSLISSILKTYQNNIYCYISSLLKRVVIQYVVAIAIGSVYGLILS